MALCCKMLDHKNNIHANELRSKAGNRLKEAESSMHYERW